MNALDRRPRTTGTLPATAPFDFRKSVRFIGRFGPTAGEQTADDGCVVKAFSVGGRAVLFEVRSGGSVERPSVAYAFDAEDALDEFAHEACRDRRRFWLSLDDDLRGFYAAASTDPPFARVVDRSYGLHHPKFPTPFENAVQALLGQRNPMALTKRRRAALIGRYGPAVTVDGETWRAFPSPSRLAAAGADEIAETIGHRVAGERIAVAARAFSDVDETWLRAAPEDDVADWLRELPGFGTWSTAFVLVRSLGRMGCMQEPMPPLLDAGRKIYGAGFDRRAAAAKLAAYGEFAGLWAFYVRTAHMDL